MHKILRTSAWGRRASIATLICVVAVATACGDDDESSEPAPATNEPVETSVSAAAPDTEAAAADDVAANVEKYSSAPTNIVQTEPLSAAPPKKSVAFVVCADPTCLTLDKYLNEAVTALGWDYESVQAPATDFGSAVQQAIDLQPDYIATTGSDAATFQPQFDAMKAADIPFFPCYSTDVPAGPENGIYSNCFDTTAVKEYGTAIADWMIVDSAATANAAIVYIPAFPILQSQADAIKDEFTAACTTCTANDLTLTIDDLSSGGGPNAIVSYLQSNPDVNYLHLTFSGLDTGLPQALESAGLAERVKIIGTLPGQPQLQEIIDGTAAMWLALPQEYSMWSLADQMARLANDEWDLANERTNAIPPFYLITTPEEASKSVDLEFGWPGPDGFKDDFKSLWGV